MFLEKQFLAPRALLCGAFSLLFLTLFTSCDESRSTPDWPTSTPKLEEPAPTSPPPAPLEGPEVTFMSYNLKNYLSMPRGKSPATMRPKPENEIRALVQNISSASPDILGVCEIGTQADLDDLQRRLKQHGVDLPHTHLHGAADTYRRLAILSRFPIEATYPATEHYKMEGKSHLMLRGILDAEIALPAGPVRFIGVHLKSKRESKFWDQERIRRHEAQCVRNHINTLTQSSTTPIILYGDFNDTKQSPTIRAISGSNQAPGYLLPLRLTDTQGAAWTQHWAYQDVYSRFDYIFVSTHARPRINHSKSFILTLPTHDPASDHRPLILNMR
ncbi:endonuclease/exonuclease/phosphatase family protein [Rubritalea tangerina]|uniref:Endonuclease/exonuclease/phosphatase family protein n=2 Tax=Rubritalea tangerina TaxID=430798 RepID=A0ABW4Z9V8_9BACT